MLEKTTSIPNHTIKTGDTIGARTSKLYMLGINCRFSSIILDEFRAPIEGNSINAYGELGEGRLEAEDRAPDALKLLCILPTESDVMTLFGVYRPWYRAVFVFASSLADAVLILASLGPTTQILYDQQSCYLVGTDYVVVNSRNRVFSH